MRRLHGQSTGRQPNVAGRNMQRPCHTMPMTHHYHHPDPTNPWLPWNHAQDSQNTCRHVTCTAACGKLYFSSKPSTEPSRQKQPEPCKVTLDFAKPIPFTAVRIAWWQHTICRAQAHDTQPAASHGAESEFKSTHGSVVLASMGQGSTQEADRTADAGQNDSWGVDIATPRLNGNGTGGRQGKQRQEGWAQSNGPGVEGGMTYDVNQQAGQQMEGSPTGNSGQASEWGQGGEAGQPGHKGRLMKAVQPEGVDALAADSLVIEFDGDVPKAQEQLTRLLRDAQDVSRAQALVRQHKALLNGAHVCAVLTRLKWLVGEWGRFATGPRKGEVEEGKGGNEGKGGANAQGRSLRRRALVEATSWLSTFLPSTMHLLPSFTMVEVAGCLHALARLNHRPPLTWMDQLLETALPLLSTAATPAQLGNTVWSLAKLGCDPGSEWLDAACAASIPVMRRRPRRRDAQAGRQGRGGGSPSNKMFDGGYLGPPSWVIGRGQGTEDEEAGEDEEEVCADSSVVAFSWGLAKLQHNVSPVWGEAICAEIAARWWGMDMFCLSNLAWALTTLAVHPGREWLQEFCEVCPRHFYQANSYDLSVLLWAHVTWGHRPPQQWFDSFFAAFLRLLPQAQPAHIARCLWCCATLGLRPPNAWLKRVIQQTQVQAFEFDGQAASNSFWALAKLRIRPPTDWLETMLVASYEKGLKGWGPQELSNAMWALGRWEHAPEEAWADLYWSEAYCVMDKFSVCLLSQMSFRTMRRHSLEGISTILTCLGKMQHPPPKAWLKGFFATTLPVMRKTTAALLERGPPHKSTDGLTLDKGVPTLDTSVSILDIAKATPTLERAGLALGDGPWTGSLARAAQGPGSTGDAGVRGAGDMSAERDNHGLVAIGLVCEKLITPITMFRIAPPKQWTEAYLEMSLAAMPYMRQGNLACVSYGVVMLRMNPSPAWVSAMVHEAEGRLMPLEESQVNRISVGKLMFAAHKLPGAEGMYQRWRACDWITDALDMFDL